ncbi:3188_t:CDS:2, partial [Entrophospora sp. SA101]
WNDYALLLLTFFSTIFISTEYGTLISVGLSLVLVVKHSTYPRITIMVNFPDQAEHVEGVLVIKISEPLYFANTGQLKDRLRRLEEFGDMSVHPSEDARMSPVKNVIFDIETMEGIDASQKKMFEGAGIIEKVGKEHFFNRIPDALEYINNGSNSFSVRYE